jgi:solute carrier family 25 (mitochondrial phosphate transporter), member 3
MCCTGITHGALTPVDVVKTKIQLDPITYNKGLIGGFGQVVKAEGFGGLLTGFGPTVAGYFVQGLNQLGCLKYNSYNPRCF